MSAAADLPNANATPPENPLMMLTQCTHRPNIFAAAADEKADAASCLLLRPKLLLPRHLPIQRKRLRL
jgi:hypothetical protein